MTIRNLGLSLDDDWERIEVLRQLDGVEILNGQLSNDKNKKAKSLAMKLNKPGIAGSDSHFIKMTGKSATRFKKPIKSDGELVQALKSCDYSVLRIRKINTSTEITLTIPPVDLARGNFAKGEDGVEKIVLLLIAVYEIRMATDAFVSLKNYSDIVLRIDVARVEQESLLWRSAAAT